MKTKDYLSVPFKVCFIWFWVCKLIWDWNINADISQITPMVKKTKGKEEPKLSYSDWGRMYKAFIFIFLY